MSVDEMEAVPDAELSAVFHLSPPASPRPWRTPSPTCEEMDIDEDDSDSDDSDPLASECEMVLELGEEDEWLAFDEGEELQECANREEMAWELDQMLDAEDEAVLWDILVYKCGLFEHIHSRLHPRAGPSQTQLPRELYVALQVAPSGVGAVHAQARLRRRGLIVTAVSTLHPSRVMSGGDAGIVRDLSSSLSASRGRCASPSLRALVGFGTSDRLTNLPFFILTGTIAISYSTPSPLVPSLTLLTSYYLRSSSPALISSFSYSAFMFVLASAPLLHCPHRPLLSLTSVCVVSPRTLSFLFSFFHPAFTFGLHLTFTARDFLFSEHLLIPSRSITHSPSLSLCPSLLLPPHLPLPALFSFPLHSRWQLSFPVLASHHIDLLPSDTNTS
ncbi:hypothetical protein B0H10DRAFT_2209272 [Mycena sp. CBHHK59/15]|nr:hypothetical protein B0H10DRAFT_2209272 [Mycena sp. CBHHK59/15]